MLNTPASVDSLPRLRRFSPSRVQTTSCAYLGHDEGPPGAPQEEGKGGEEKPKDEKEEEGKEGRRRGEQGKSSSGVLCRSASAESQGPPGRQACGPQADPQGRKGLVEVPLSVLKPLDGQGLETGGEGETGGDGEDQKMCCGFFYKDDVKGEEDMAAKRAALLEKRLRREKEAQEKRQEQEQEQEERKEAARLKAEEEQVKKEDEKARRDYIKNEYLRRKQLKLMDDMDDVIKPRPGSLKKKPRPKSIHRDVMESPKPPVRAGVRPRGYSVSSVSLASLNLADHDTSSLPDNKRTLRPDSAGGFSSVGPSRPDSSGGFSSVVPSRPDSSGGFSSCPSAGSRNGEKDWENESTTSSTPSTNTEYTGPKLYKEPSAKSNKHIIQNALAHCCLAGKVNEGQKTKILDEMEKSQANNFLVLFRDAGCQFRSLYTYCPESEEIAKLAGVGPKSVTLKMVEGLYKYNSDRKQFSNIPAKTMSASVDAITIAGHLWQTKKQQGTPKKK